MEDVENKLTISKFEYDNLNRIKYKYELILNDINKLQKEVKKLEKVK